jgi:hypothetical protein
VGVGLQSLVLGIALNIILLYLGFYLLLCGIICHVVKKHPGLVIGWGTFLPCAHYLPYFTSIDMRMIFYPYTYRSILIIQLIISYAFWMVLFILVFITAKNTSVKKHPLLFCGWAIFSQIYNFIFIAFDFGHIQEIMKFYLVLSWCTIIFLIVLVYYTMKYIYNYFKSENAV